MVFTIPRFGDHVVDVNLHLLVHHVVKQGSHRPWHRPFSNRKAWLSNRMCPPYLIWWWRTSLSDLPRPTWFGCSLRNRPWMITSHVRPLSRRGHLWWGEGSHPLDTLCWGCESRCRLSRVIFLCNGNYFVYPIRIIHRSDEACLW